MSNKFYYTWQDFDNHVDDIVNNFGQGSVKPHVIGIHRGSLPLAVKLSNQFNNGMSIIKFQTRDGGDKVPSFILNEIPEEGPILIVDDIYDTGNTLNVIRKYMSGYKDRIAFVCLTENDLTTKPEDMTDVTTYRVTGGLWVVFPWE